MYLENNNKIAMLNVFYLHEKMSMQVLIFFKNKLYAGEYKGK